MISNTNPEIHAQQLSLKLGKLFDEIQPFLSNRDAHYESSWKKRGGPGAFNTIARPWDRFEAIAKREGQDIFKILQSEIDKGLDENIDGTLHACIRDLLCYMALLMVEAKQMRRVYKPGAQWEVRGSGETCEVAPVNKHQESIKHGSLSEMMREKEAKMATGQFRIAEHVTKVNVGGDCTSLPQRTADEQKAFVKRANITYPKFIFPCGKCHSMLEVITTETVQCPVCKSTNRVTISTNC